MMRHSAIGGRAAALLVGVCVAVLPGTPARAAIEPDLPADEFADIPPLLPPPSPAMAEPEAFSPAAGALVLDTDRQDSVSDCAGRDVLIHASFSHIVLRGGCRSILVQGQDDTIMAEVTPGSRIAIGGASVRLGYTLVSEGPPPVVSATATGAAVFAQPR